MQALRCSGLHGLDTRRRLRLGGEPRAARRTENTDECQDENTKSCQTSSRNECTADYSTDCTVKHVNSCHDECKNECSTEYEQVSLVDPSPAYSPPAPS